MKRKFSIIVSLLFLVTITATWLSSPGYAFWYGDVIPEDGAPFFPPGAPREDIRQPLEDVLNEIVPLIQGEMFRDGFLNPYPGEGVTKHCEPGKCWEGYTLLSCNGGFVDDMGTPDDESDDVVYPTILIDMDGNIVRKWTLTAFPSKSLPYGHVIGGEGNFELPGNSDSGVDGIPALVQQDWHGNVVWRWDGDRVSEPKRAGQHHDFQRSGNPVGYYAPNQTPHVIGGKTLILSDYLPPMDLTCPDESIPYDPVTNTGCMSKYQIWDAAIYEVDWHGNIIWEWYTWEHFNQLGFDQPSLDAIYEIRSGPGNDAEANDYIHTNTVGYLGQNQWYSLYHDDRFHPDNIIWCSRQANIIAIVSKETGEIVWKMGPDYSPGNPEACVGQIIGPHMPHLIPKGLPGQGNMLIFDNGGFAGWGSLFPGMPGTEPNKFRNYSRVIEFNPRSFKVVWEYKFIAKEEGERTFFSTFISGAQRLFNGNTLICEGGPGRVFEVDKDGNVVWEFINPWTGPVSGPPVGSKAVYRAYRVPYSWAGRH